MRLMELQAVLRKLTPILVSFLNNTLPKICENWWDEFVVNKLSDHQRRQIEIRNLNTLESLDLAALLRIFNYNWREISENKKLPIEVKNYINDISNIRNKYAHLGMSLPNKEDEFRDLDTIQRLISSIDKNNILIGEVKILKDTIFTIPVSVKLLEPDIEKDKLEIQKEKLSIADEPVGVWVKKYIPKILEYCFNTDISELDKLKNKDYSKMKFGINYPFLIEVVESNAKVHRYWKTVYLYDNRYFVITSEWFKWNKIQFLEYLSEKQLIKFANSEQLAITESSNSHNIVEEKRKVENRIPRWFRAKKQINSQILIKYLELLGKDEFVYFPTLESNFKHLKTFQSNFNQMKNFGEKNHAKVFKEDINKIYLWPPVKEFILEQYRLYNKFE